MQKAVLTARGHVDATWHSGPRGSATRAHAAAPRGPTRQRHAGPRGIYIMYIFIIIYSIKFFSLAYMGRGNRTS